jgi:hypothetical protein
VLLLLLIVLLGLFAVLGMLPDARTLGSLCAGATS